MLCAALDDVKAIATSENHGKRPQAGHWQHCRGFAGLGLKFLAYLWTGSVALYSDAVESIINVAAAVAALIAVWYSARPADDNHPYGHHKAEYFSAVLEGALIIVAAVAILHEAYAAYLAPRTIEAPIKGLLVNGAPR